MRYIAIFSDGSTKRLKEAEAKEMMLAKTRKDAILFRGALFDHTFVKAIKPIDKHWFDPQTVADHRELEEAERDRLGEANAKALGFTDARTLHETTESPKRRLIEQLTSPIPWHPESHISR